MSYTTVVAGTAITASWSNANVRDQVVTPFASAAARTSAIAAPVECMVTGRTDDDLYEGYNGTAWVPVSPHTMGSVATRITDASATTTESLVHSVTFTAVAGRLYLHVFNGVWASSAASDNCTFRVRYAAGASVANTDTLARGATFTSTNANYQIPLSFESPIAGIAAGQATVGIFILRTFGSGTLSVKASATEPAYSYVQDKGKV